MEKLVQTLRKKIEDVSELFRLDAVGTPTRPS
jgi:hypothetical protein